MPDHQTALEILRDRKLPENLKKWQALRKVKRSVQGTNNLTNPNKVEDKVEDLVNNKPKYFNHWKKLGWTTFQIEKYIYAYLTKIS
jgi:hypothetical protein